MRIGFLCMLCLVSLMGLAAESLTLNRALLSDGRWFNDEFSFDFGVDGSYKAFYTDGDQNGAMRGQYRIDEGANSVIIEIGTKEDSFDSSFTTGNSIILKFKDAPADPKASRILLDDRGLLVLWNKNYFVKENSAAIVSGIPVLTLGDKLSAVTSNLRIRKGPGTSFDYLQFHYRDGSTNQVKTFTSILDGTNIRVIARTMEKQQVQEWNNYWFYIEYKEPSGSLMTYHNAWCFAEFISGQIDTSRTVGLASPANEDSFYNVDRVDFTGSVSGKPIKMRVQIKRADGTIKSEEAVNLDKDDWQFSWKALKSDRSLALGSNIYNFLAFYSDGKKVSNQVTVYVHESMGEKAKPVIYLYPTVTTEVSVRLTTKWPLSKSEPSYGTGWQVQATPEGLLTDLATGKTWPYLFWEAPEDSVLEPTSGFVVATSDLEKFFTVKLDYLGMNEREIGDFCKFWLPIMTKGPYYLIWFYDKSQIEASAPLNISPKPNSVIRVYFDSRMITKPINIPEQKLAPVTRQGFAVVEWGGRKH